MTWCSVPVQANLINRLNWQRRGLRQHRTAHPPPTRRPKSLLLTACKTPKPLISPAIWAKVPLSTLRAQTTSVSPRLWSPNPVESRFLTVSTPLQCQKKNITCARAWVSRRASSRYPGIKLVAYLKNSTSALTRSYPRSNYNINLTRSLPPGQTKRPS